MINLNENDNRNKMLIEISDNYQMIFGFKKYNSEFDKDFLLKITENLENKYFKQNGTTAD